MNDDTEASIMDPNRRLFELTALYQVSRMLLEPYPLPRIAFDTLTSLLGLTGAEWALFWQVMRDGRQIRLVQRLGPAPETTGPVQLSEQAASLLSDDPRLLARADLTELDLPEYTQLTNAEHLLPLAADGSLQGLIALGPLAVGRPLPSSARELLEHIGHIVAIALGRMEGAGDLEDAEGPADMETILKKNPPLEQLIGRSAGMLTLLNDLVRVAGTDCTVLLQGETGTGKQLTAQVIHELSPRTREPFIELDCGAIPENLVENELFGHAKGAYTDARQEQRGVFQLADGGTLFLDEIGDLPFAVQRRLLRVLQERRFRPIGSEQDIEVDIRLIAATNKDLGQAVREGSFREDLFYRLYVYPIRLPPLREREGDIPLLAGHLLRRVAERSSLSTPRLDGDLLERLSAYPFPGNVRELAHLMERLLIRAHGHDLLTADMLDTALATSVTVRRDPVDEDPSLRPTPATTEYAGAGTERGQWVLDLLRNHRFNVSEAADELASLIKEGHNPPLTGRSSLTYYFQGEAFRAFLQFGGVMAAAEQMAGDRPALVPKVRRRIDRYIEQAREAVTHSPSVDQAQAALRQRFAKMPEDYAEVLDELAAIVHQSS